MKLFYSAASPFARKVTITAHEVGLFDRITIIPGAVSPIEKEKAINQHNPAGKLPTLVTDSGEAIFDSRVICEYLDALGGGRMFPVGEARWKALVLQSLADEAMDACILTRYESVLRPEALRWSEWREGQINKVLISLDTLETAWIHYLGAHFDIGVLTVACLLGYLDFRFPELDWRAGRPMLTAWFEGASRRPSVAATVPKV
jgi:glutathione S-transferase